MKYDFAYIYLVESAYRATTTLGFPEEDPLSIYRALNKYLTQDDSWLTPNLREEITAVFFCSSQSRENWVTLDQKLEIVIPYQGRYAGVKLYPVRLDEAYVLVFESDICPIPHMVRAIFKWGRGPVEPLGGQLPCSYLQISDSQTLAFSAVEYKGDYDVQPQVANNLYGIVYNALRSARNRNDALAIIAKLETRLKFSKAVSQAVSRLNPGEFIFLNPIEEDKQLKVSKTSRFGEPVEDFIQLKQDPKAVMLYPGNRPLCIHRIAPDIAGRDGFIELAEFWGFTRVSQPISAPVAVNAFADKSRLVHYGIVW